MLSVDQRFFLFLQISYFYLLTQPHQMGVTIVSTRIWDKNIQVDIILPKELMLKYILKQIVL